MAMRLVWRRTLTPSQSLGPSSHPMRVGSKRRNALEDVFSAVGEDSE